MWLQSDNFATKPAEDFVISQNILSKSTIPIDTLFKIAPQFPKDIFSVIMVDIVDTAIATNLLPHLVSALEPKGILVVAIGDKSPNDDLGQVILDVVSQADIVIPPLMVRFQRNGGQPGYAFRFKKKNIQEPNNTPIPTKGKTKKTSSKK